VAHWLRRCDCRGKGIALGVRTRKFDRPGEDVRRQRRRRIRRWSVGTVCAILATLLVAFSFLYQHLNHNLTALDPDLGNNRPSRVLVPGDRQPLNILMVGTRAPTEAASATTGSGIGEPSDTTVLLHVSADRERGYGVSIPRDLRVSRPECPATAGDRMVPADPAADFGAAYAVGREGCTVRTVEKLTNIRIDHFLVTSFDGLRKTADALGGVPITMPSEAYDPRLELTLPAGQYDVTGDQALSYVTIELGSSGDIGRIRRQQAFLAAMANKALSSGTLSNPFRLYDFLDEVTQAVAVDKDWASLGALADFARDLKDLGSDNMHFLTMPTRTTREGRLAPARSAGELWNQLRQDQILSAEQLLGASTAKSAPTD
jgi:LCP family protein required for cell wall assembly